ncbi:MAG: hypothetical protein ABIP85_27090 [Chthoniobacteraceae bacterium]
MDFYRIKYKNAPGMAWAGGYGPIEDMWFLLPVFFERKKAFWKINPHEPGLEIDPGGRKWPDILGCGFSPPGLFLSERVVLSLKKFGVPIGRVTEMPMAKIRVKALRNTLAPRYYVIETKPGIEVDFVTSGFEVDAAGKPILDPPPKRWPTYIYRLDSWNGADLFDYRHFGPTDGPYTGLLCTERIAELAKGEGWSNVEFEPIVVI